MQPDIQKAITAQESTTSSSADQTLVNRFRRTAGHFATGVVVLTSFDGEQPIGMTVQSFTSVSLEPLLVSIALSRRSATWERIRASGQVCINILASDQQELSRHFASQVADRFSGVRYAINANGLPTLQSVLAWLDCAIEDTHVVGDHDVALCSVRDLAVARAAEPLLFFRGMYSSLASERSAGDDSRTGLPPAW